MTMYAIFPSADGVTHLKPVAMFTSEDLANKWGKASYGGNYKLREIEITRCDVVERRELVGS